MYVILSEEKEMCLIKFKCLQLELNLKPTHLKWLLDFNPREICITVPKVMVAMCGLSKGPVNIQISGQGFIYIPGSSHNLH